MVRQQSANKRFPTLYRKFRKLKGRLNAGVITDTELEHMDRINRELSSLVPTWTYTKLERR